MLDREPRPVPELPDSAELVIIEVEREDGVIVWRRTLSRDAYGVAVARMLYRSALRGDAPRQDLTGD